MIPQSWSQTGHSSAASEASGEHRAQVREMLADKGIWFSSQAFLDNEFANRYPDGSANRAKQLTMFAGTDTAYGLAKKYRFKVARGTDILHDPATSMNQGAILGTMSRWHSNDEILNGQLLAMSGPRNPYPEKLGVIDAGAYADVLLVDGDPDVMKDGRIYKNTLAWRQGAR